MAPSHPRSPDDLLAEKKALRVEVLARRACLSAQERAAAARAATDIVLAEVTPRPGQAVSIFWPLPGEIDTRLLLERLHADGVRPLLPRLQGFGRPLAFHLWQPGLVLVPGRLGLQEPAPTTPEAVPEIILTPLIAFDAQGHRLGYGAGFYDRTFGALEAQGREPLRVGYAFACQEVAAVPVDAHDWSLHLLVTERGVRRCAAA